MTTVRRQPPQSHHPRLLSGAVARNETADHHVIAINTVPDDGVADRIAGVIENGVGRHWHPVAVNRNPVLIFSHIVIGAMAVGDVAAWHAVLRLDALEPRPHR